MGDDEAVEQQPPSDEGDENTGATSQPDGEEAENGEPTSKNPPKDDEGHDTSIFGGP